MTFAKVDLIGALRVRYDHYSAESMFGVARERAALADKSAYDAAEVRALRTVLAGINDRLATVLARLDAMLGDAGGATTAPPAAVPAVPAAPPAPAAKAERDDAAEHAHDGGRQAKDGGKQAKDGGKQAKDGGKHARSVKDVGKPASDGGKHEALATTLVLTGVAVGEGEQVLVCGGLPALGDWDPARACVMVRDADAWIATLPVAPDADVAFKFARRAKDGTVTWEAGDNRQLAGTPRLETTWR